MILITGGAYQGKLEYAKKKYKKNTICNAADSTVEQIKASEIVYNYHLFIKKLSTENEDAVEITKSIIEANPDIIVVSDEVGCGIVPIDRTERKWREDVGRSCSLIAERSETVIRMVCGCPMIIKGEKN